MTYGRISPAHLEVLRMTPLGPMQNRLRVALALSGARQADLAEWLSVTPAAVSRLVKVANSKSDPRLTAKVAGFFGPAVCVDDIFPALRGVEASAA
jgi:hypothetical protein